MEDQVYNHRRKKIAWLQQLRIGEVTNEINTEIAKLQTIMQRYLNVQDRNKVLCIAGFLCWGERRYHASCTELLEFKWIVIVNLLCSH